MIQDHITAILQEQEQCSVMLTGGQSAERLYTDWSALTAFQLLSGVCFYFGDERCVPPDHPDSNYGLAMRTLFQQGVPAGCSVFRMEADDLKREAAARRYGETLPEHIDVMLLGVGEDGHIASLFPGSGALNEVTNRVVPVTCPKRPRERLTITPLVIAKAKSIFVLAPGVVKNRILAKALESSGDSDVLPAHLLLKATWLLDTPFLEVTHELSAKE